jgi:hypothetical protein
MPPAPPSRSAVADALAAARTLNQDASTMPAPLTTIVHKGVSVLRKRSTLAQLTPYAVGALALFLVIGGEQLYEKTNGKGGNKPGVATGESPSVASNKPPKLTPREFYLLDRDRSGFLTPDEVRGDAVLEQNFKKIDSNHDGRISLDEFTSYPPD